MRGPKRLKSLQPRSSCRCIDPIGLHEEISRDFPTCMDFLNHLQSKGAAPSQDFGRPRTRAENICKLGLAVTEFLDRVTEHIHRVEPAPAPEWPAPFLIALDQCHENVELIALWRSSGRAPKLLDLRECGTMVFAGADRTDLHGGPHQNLATVSGAVPLEVAMAMLQRTYRRSRRHPSHAKGFEQSYLQVGHSGI